MVYAFATIEDYEARWGKVDEGREAIVCAALDDAGLILRSYVDAEGASQELVDKLRLVSLNMVKRAMATYDGGVYGASQTEATMGPFNQSVQWANPSGDMYITSSEKDLLGIGSSWIAAVPARIEGYYGSNA